MYRENAALCSVHTLSLPFYLFEQNSEHGLLPCSGDYVSGYHISSFRIGKGTGFAREVKKTILVNICNTARPATARFLGLEKHRVVQNRAI